MQLSRQCLRLIQAIAYFSQGLLLTNRNFFHYAQYQMLKQLSLQFHIQFQLALKAENYEGANVLKF